ncbi:MAG: DUF4153 domain-containing protein [Methylocystis sp.]|uniref:DUF4153 domain-containing protein n=1 Tax=Methylocystis sp. TaxID=1911079 RepID=UPI003D09E693
MSDEAHCLSLRPPTRWLIRHAAIAAALVALGDWLFYDAVTPGLSLALFLAACGLAAMIANPVRARGPLRLVALSAFALAGLAIVEDLSWVSFFLASGATLLFALIMVSGDVSAWPRQLRRALSLPFVGGLWLLGDLLRARKLWLRNRRRVGRLAALTAWVAPVLLSITFLFLFASANPLIDDWALLLDPRRLLDFLSVARAGFWLMIACLVWPFVHMRRGRIPPNATPDSPATANRDLDILFGGAAVLRSLVMFNALFAVQTSLDIAYLWGGLTLPHGLTYAAYAHRGAYPLIATAVLAAIFVLIAMRPGGPTDYSPRIRPLVLLWVAQNVLLVLSSMFRTSLYVSAYSMSELRLAAMIWMGLVAIGLILIVVQIVQRKSNRWLLNANAAAAAAVLYASCFVNFPYIVANYNVEHCLEATGAGPALDLQYLFSLGAQAMPAYDAFRRAQRGSWERPDWAAIRSEAQESLAAMGWRDWSFRQWRLKRYFDNDQELREAADSGAPGDH